MLILVHDRKVMSTFYIYKYYSRRAITVLILFPQTITIYIKYYTLTKCAISYLHSIQTDIHI